MTQRCPIACGLCQPPLSIDCLPDRNSTFVMDQYGLTCEDLGQVSAIELWVCSRLWLSRDCFCFSLNLQIAHLYSYFACCVQLGMCTAYQQNEASARLAEVMRVYCSGTCRSCDSYFANVTCTSFDNSTAALSIFGQTCAQLAQVTHGSWTAG